MVHISSLLFSLSRRLLLHLGSNLRSFPILLFLIGHNFRYSAAVVTVHEQDLLGEIEAGNYTYYQLKTDFGRTTKNAAAVLLLFTKEGDADLFVSWTTDKPTFAYGENDYQSTTCGIDRVDINLNVKKRIGPKGKSRPLMVGVYGHSSHPVSRYVLKILLFLDDDPNEDGASVDQSMHNDEDYMSDEMLVLAANDEWLEWVQQVHVSESDLVNWIDVPPLTDAIRREESGFNQLLKGVAEILLAILSFALNILVEIMV